MTINHRKVQTTPEDAEQERMVQIMEFKEVVKARYSCKKFDPAQVEKEKLDAILEAGRLAPTAKNLQEQHIYVVQSPEVLAKIDSITPCRYGAPTVLVVAFDKNNVFTYPGGKRDSGVEDATIVATHLILAAADEYNRSSGMPFQLGFSIGTCSAEASEGKTMDDCITSCRTTPAAKTLPRP